MSRVALFIFYAGRLPDYFRYFLESFARNQDSNTDLYLFNDRFTAAETVGNIKKIPLTFEQFNELASIKLGLPINTNWGYKLCEFRPAFGVIFEDYLKDYDFWGYCDPDIILGKISNFITEEVLTNHDVITASEIQFVGHFTLFRNTDVINNLFRQTDDYIKIFSDNSHYYNFDESCQRFYGRPLSFDELKSTNQLAGIYDIVLNLKEQYHLRIYMNAMCREEPPFNFTYRDGTFFDLITQKEFLYFHLVKAKLFYLFRFYIPPMQSLPSEFSIVTEGIIPHSPTEGAWTRWQWNMQRSRFILQYYLTKAWIKLKAEPQKTLPGWERQTLNSTNDQR
jgi:hypothetical protein